MKRLNLLVLLVLACSLSACVQYSGTTDVPDYKKTETSYAKTQLKRQLLQAKVQYQDLNELFIIDIVYKDISVMQILRRQMLEDVDDQMFGYGIHLNFNLQQTEEMTQLRMFHQLPVLDIFSLYEVINSPTFQIDLGEDLDRIEAMTWMLLQTVFGGDRNDVRFELSGLDDSDFYVIPHNLSQLKGPSSQLPD